MQEGRKCNFCHFVGKSNFVLRFPLYFIVFWHLVLSIKNLNTLSWDLYHDSLYMYFLYIQQNWFHQNVTYDLLAFTWRNVISTQRFHIRRIFGRSFDLRLETGNPDKASENFFDTWLQNRVKTLWITCIRGMWKLCVEIISSKSRFITLTNTDKLSF